MLGFDPESAGHWVGLLIGAATLLGVFGGFVKYGARGAKLAYTFYQANLQTAAAVTRIELRLTILEEWVRAVVSEAAYGVFHTDADGEYIWTNRAYSRMVGRGVDEVIGAGWISAVAPEDRREVSEEWKLAVEQEREFVAEYSLLDVDGFRHPVRTRAVPLRLSDGGLLGFVGFVYPREIRAS
jgi:PAS domain S-box-containing protein